MLAGFFFLPLVLLLGNVVELIVRAVEPDWKSTRCEVVRIVGVPGLQRSRWYPIPVRVFIRYEVDGKIFAGWRETVAVWDTVYYDPANPTRTSFNPPVDFGIGLTSESARISYMIAGVGVLLYLLTALTVAIRLSTLDCRSRAPRLDDE